MAPVEKKNGICYISDEFWYVWELFARTNIRDLRNVNIFNVSNYIHRFWEGGGYKTTKLWLLNVAVFIAQVTHSTKLSDKEKGPKGI